MSIVNQDQAREVLSTLDRTGVAAATSQLLALPPRDVVVVCREVVLELFKSRRDVTRGLLVGWSGATEAERLARHAPRIHGLEREFLDHARSLYAVVGSLSWPGWAEVRLRLDATARQIGRACAERSSELAVELDAEPLVRAKARWLVAMHALFADDLEPARLHLIEAGRLAEEGGADDEVLLLRGYLLLVQARSEPDDPEIGFEIERICTTLEGDANTVELADQLRTARSALEDVELEATHPLGNKPSSRMT